MGLVLLSEQDIMAEWVPMVSTAKACKGSFPPMTHKISRQTTHTLWPLPNTQITHTHFKLLEITDDAGFRPFHFFVSVLPASEKLFCDFELAATTHSIDRATRGIL